MCVLGLYIAWMYTVNIRKIEGRWDELCCMVTDMQIAISYNKLLMTVNYAHLFSGLQGFHTYCMAG